MIILSTIVWTRIIVVVVVVENWIIFRILGDLIYYLIK